MSLRTRELRRFVPSATRENSITIIVFYPKTSLIFMISSDEKAFLKTLTEAGIVTDIQTEKRFKKILRTCYLRTRTFLLKGHRACDFTEEDIPENAKCRRERKRKAQNAGASAKTKTPPGTASRPSGRCQSQYLYRSPRSREQACRSAVH